MVWLLTCYLEHPGSQRTSSTSGHEASGKTDPNAPRFSASKAFAPGKMSVLANCVIALSLVSGVSDSIRLNASERSRHLGIADRSAENFSNSTRKPTKDPHQVRRGFKKNSRIC
jgi:hypothetical protein